jgi:hypothetical protein
VNEKIAALKGGAMPPPEGMVTKATSTLYDEAGNQILQWVKADVDKTAQLAAEKAAFEALCEKLPREQPVTGPMLFDMDLLSAYVIGDAHFGLLAWGEETGKDFDLKIAERELKAAVAYLVRTSPESAIGLLVDVGDFMHADSRKPMTPQSGNILDVDSRYLKAVRVVIRTFRYMIELLLLKHDKVKVIIAPGNHNPNSAGWMALTLAMFYENEPRIEVDQHPGAYFYHKFGKCLIGVTHGDTCKFADLPSIMAADKPKEWGDTEHRHFLTGHIHHTKQQEFRGCFAESFNTLAASDAWHAMSGYRSKRQMQRLDFHRDHGVVSRFTCNVGMIQEPK